VNIAFLQAIKDVPIYSKTIKGLCLRKPERKKKVPQFIHIMGKRLELMMGGTLVETKYSNCDNLVVNVKINNIIMPNTLIDFGIAINFMT